MSVKVKISDPPIVQSSTRFKSFRGILLYENFISTNKRTFYLEMVSHSTFNDIIQTL